ncbi:MAG: hypothetical protein LBD91_01315 [Prevotellaceae bacterium]|nr:hypothetical protein [Prevotellaceae bacterium]
MPHISAAPSGDYPCKALHATPKQEYSRMNAESSSATSPLQRLLWKRWESIPLWT